MTQDGKLAQGFEALYTEMEKVRRHGFTQGEFERAQNDLMRRAERSYTNRNDAAATPSSYRPTWITTSRIRPCPTPKPNGSWTAC